MQYKLGFIGTGVMAGTILDRALSNLDKLNIDSKDIYIYDLDENKTNYFKAKGVSVAKCENDVFLNCDMVLLGVKPQFFPSVMENVFDIKCNNVISIMAGVTIETLRKYFGNDMSITRVMPNTPCKIGKGMVALCFNKVSDSEQVFINDLFSACGKTLVITEDKFHAVIGISGSGPAYLYMFANALIKSGMEAGLSKDESSLLAFEMLEGSSAYAKNSGIDLDTMVDMVCSKGGTTIEAVKSFRDSNFDVIVSKAVKACIDRSKELSENK